LGKYGFNFLPVISRNILTISHIIYQNLYFKEDLKENIYIILQTKLKDFILLIIIKQ
jgi:hypothetical protein